MGIAFAFSADSGSLAFDRQRSALVFLRASTPTEPSQRMFVRRLAVLADPSSRFPRRLSSAICVPQVWPIRLYVLPSLRTSPFIAMKQPTLKFWLSSASSKGQPSAREASSRTKAQENTDGGAVAEEASRMDSSAASDDDSAADTTKAVAASPEKPPAKKRRVRQIRDESDSSDHEASAKVAEPSSKKARTASPKRGGSPKSARSGSPEPPHQATELEPTSLASPAQSPAAPAAVCSGDDTDADSDGATNADSDDEPKPKKSKKASSPKKPAKSAKTAGIFGMSTQSKPSESQWKAGSKVPYAALCETFVQIEATTKRLEITDILTKFFQRVISLSPSNLTQCIYLCINRIGPEYEGRELHVGDSILMKAVVEATGRNLQALKADVVEHGDLGTVAEQSRGKQRTLATPQPLTVPQVFDTLKTISEITGTSSQKRKIDLIRKMLVACRENEAKYIIRSLAGTLRIGLAEQTVLQSLARAFVLNDSETRKMSKDKLENELASATAIVKQVYTELPTYDQIVPALLEHGVHHLPEHCKLTPGIPLKPMLAHPTKSLTEVLDRFENMTFSCEYKYDGERAQIHRLEDGSVMIFSRNSENLSVKYPDIIARVPAISKPDVTSFVLDCEAVAWDREKKCILPFQVLSTRKKKDVTAEEVKIQVCVFVFDLLYFNGKPVTGEPLKTRRQLLEENFIEIEGGFHFSKSMESSNVEEIQTFLNEAIVGNCEGLMVKTLEKEASYEPSKRSRNWLKVKKDYLSGLGDSLDLVVIGGWYGRGKRTGTYGAYLLACYDEDREEYQSICKMGTGFDDESLAGHYKFLSEHTIEAPKNYYNISDNPNVRPDVWFDAVQVWEVKCADLSISPVHRAAMGLVAEDKGISLRFPRFIRIRDDKGPSDATSAAQVAEMYQSQNINPVHGNKSRDDDF